MSASSSPARRRPCVLRVDAGGAGRRAATTSASSVDRLLADIAFQWRRERRRVVGSSGRRRRADRHQDPMTTSMTEGPVSVVSEPVSDDDDVYDEAASAYWWTDVFLRYFVFDDDCEKPTAAADSDDLLFFVRRRRNKRKSKRRRPSLQRQRRRIAYDTRAYRKQQHQRQQYQQPTLLPIGDPAVLWRHTVCLNTIVHRLQYTLTVAVCTRVPHKSAGVDYFFCDEDANDFFDLANGRDQDHDIQLLSRHVHTVYASTSGRRMDAAKGPKERPVYPAVCWAADDYAEAFRTVIVRPGQTVCAELVAAWSGPVVVEECVDSETTCDVGDVDVDSGLGRPLESVSVKVRQNQNRAVLFHAAVPYAAVRAAFECKMSVYREAERRRRKRCNRGGAKKSSLGAALSASLTALFAGGGKDPTFPARTSDGCGGDYDYYYGAIASATADRIEYVTVRGCQPGSDDGWTSDDEDDRDGGSDRRCYSDTKGLGQMAVTLAPVQPMETGTPSYENCSEHHRQYFGGEDDVVDVGYDYDCSRSYTPVGYCDGVDDDYTMTVVAYNQQRQLESPSPYAASEPGDFYDYGWEYEASSGHQTPQTPSYHYQQQHRRQLDRQRRRRPRRLSDPCSTSVYDPVNGGNGAGQNQYYQQAQCAAGTNVSKPGSTDRRKQQHSYQHHQYYQFGGHVRSQGTSAAATPERADKALQHPHRAWSESDGLDRCGWPYSGGGQPDKQQKPVLLPPPPVPYYCAAEAAASGFLQYVHKSPGGWRTRTRNRRRVKRSLRKKESRNKKSVPANRRRSASAGGDGNNSGCCTTTDEDNSEDSRSASDSDDGNSDGQESDGEFIGALAEAAVVGHHPEREWMQHGITGDPVSDWDRFDSESSESATEDVAVAVSDSIEWTAEIVATDLRRRCSHRSETVIPISRTLMVQDNDPNIIGKKMQQPDSAGYQLQQQKQQQPHIHNGRQQQFHQRVHMPQFRPQPSEPPPTPPALSVAFTAVACPWWTIVDDVLLVANSQEGQQNSNKKFPVMPLLTFE